MDTRKLVELLRATVEPSQGQQAEEMLQQVHKIIGFAPSLLQIVMSNDIALPVRQAGVVYLKNFINQRWQEREVEQGEPMQFTIHEQDKAMIRDSIVEAVVQAPQIIKVQLAMCVKTIVKHDFPSRWTQVVDKISIYLQNHDPLCWLGALQCLYQLIKNYEYQSAESRAPLIEAMNLLLPLIYNIIVRLLPDQSEQSVILQKQILKCFYSLIQHTLPLDLITREMFSQWMEVLRQVVDTSIPQHTLQVDEDERCDLPWWKCKKWAIHTLCRIFERYGSPVNARTEYVEFAEWYLTTFTGGILEVLLKILDQYRNKHYIAPRVLQQTLSYIDNSVSHAHSWKLLKPHMLAIIQDVLFPIMCYSESDEELWNTDPVEYIRIKFDLFEDYISPVVATQTLLVSCCKKRKDMLQRTMHLCMAVLTSQNGEYGPRQRDGALHIVGTLNEILLKKKIYKDQMDTLLTQYVFPEFQNNLGYLRARACWVLNHFASVKLKNDQVLTECVRLTVSALLNDRELPVKVEAAIAIQMLLSSQEKVHQYLEPQITAITLEVLTLIRETEIDDLTTVLQKIIRLYPTQMAPIVVELCEHIATTFTGVLESDSGSDEKTITAMGLLNTLETIITVMEDIPETMLQLEKIVLRVIVLIFQDTVMEYYEEALSLAYELTSNSISEDMWKMLELLYQVFETTGFDYFTNMMSILHNYIVIDTDAFLSNENRILAIFDMCKKVMNADTDEESEMYAAKLLEVMVLQCNGRINHCLPSFVELILARLTRKVSTSELRAMLLQVLIAILYCDPQLLFSIIETLQKSVPSTSIVSHFIKQWIHDTDCFLGLHDRKLCILGICKLLDMGPNRPPLDKESIEKLLPRCIVLFDGLKRAYANQAEADDSDSDEDDDSDGNEDAEVLSSDEDEIDDMNTEYLENLARAAKEKMPANIEMSVKIEEDEEETDDDDEDYEEEDTSLEAYTTPLDKKDCPDDEYIIFKNILINLSTSDPNMYQMLMNPLSDQQKQSLKEIFVLADQRKAQRDSKRIEQSGGYAFTVPSSVPTKFKFGS